MSDDVLTVLGEDLDAAEASGPSLDDTELRTLYEAMVLARRVDEYGRQLHESGDISFQVPSAGHEAVSAGAARALRAGDWAFPSHRDVALFLVRGGAVDALIAQLFGSAADDVLGRQMPGHPMLAGGRFVPLSGLAGTRIVQAAGCARALKARATEACTLACFGSGAVDQPGFHTGLNLAARWSAPAVFLCQAPADGGPTPTPARRADGYGMAAVRVDGDDVLAVLQATSAARRQAVAGGGPTLVEARVGVRGSRHPGAVEADRDPVARFRGYLERRGLWEAAWQEEIEARGRDRLAAAEEGARTSGHPSLETAFRDVTATMPAELRRQLRHLQSGEA